MNLTQPAFADISHLRVHNLALKPLLNPKHKLCFLSRNVGWEFYINDVLQLNDTTFKPKSRTLFSVLCLQILYDVGFKELQQIWTENPYWQYFSNEVYFQWTFPFNEAYYVSFLKQTSAEQLDLINDHIGQVLVEWEVNKKTQQENRKFMNYFKFY